MLQEESLEMLVRCIHVVVYFVIVVYLNWIRWKELRDLLQEELLEMPVGGICCFVFCNCCYLNWFRRKELRDLLQDELLEMLVGGIHIGVYFVTVVFAFVFKFCKPSAAVVRSLMFFCHCILPTLI